MLTKKNGSHIQRDIKKCIPKESPRVSKNVIIKCFKVDLRLSRHGKTAWPFCAFISNSNMAPIIITTRVDIFKLNLL